ncbi:Response regulator [Olavius algarvensis associated proteobacterium Delta 3]|nr:Response regulator [Olavius algarvensis associated proteobacterium Delta 3]
MDGVRVLVVDDETDFLDMIVRRLKQRVLDVSGVTSGDAAVRVIREHPVDVVILDMRMPEMDGIETLQEIKKLSPMVEVIVLTGYANMESAMRVMEMGAFDYLMKPSDMDDLEYKIQDAYQEKRLNEKMLNSSQGNREKT